MKISIIIPTFNERDTLRILVNKILGILADIEIIIVDDNSPDGTGKLADNLAKKYKNIKVVHRKKRLGLSSAIILGFDNSKGKIVGVIDGDLSHPPEAIPKLIEPIIKKESDFVIGSRNIEGGGVETWLLHRRIISKLATLLVKPLTKVRDPLSGFFFLKKDVINNINFTSKGYKICLEILVKGHYKNVLEVPYKFRNRELGDSKLNMLEYLNFVKDVINLIRYKLSVR